MVKLINVFYCNPYSSWEKGGIERNHEFIRYIIPKGITFDQLTDKNIIDMMNNINNVKRKSMEYKTPYEISLTEENPNIEVEYKIKMGLLISTVKITNINNI